MYECLATAKHAIQWRHCTGRGINAAGGWQCSDRDLWSLTAAATFCSGACSLRTLALLRPMRECCCSVGQRVSTVPLPHPNGSANGSASVQLVDCLRTVCMIFCGPCYSVASCLYICLTFVEHIQRTNFCSLLSTKCLVIMIFVV